MRKRSSIPITFFLALIILIIGCVMKAEALEPRLLWKKEFKASINTQLAKESGDVVIDNGIPDIILIDKSGNTRFAWGPRVDRNAYFPNISDNGNVITFTSSWKKEYVLKMKKRTLDERVHYVQRNGKELWSKPYPPMAYLELDYSGFYKAYLSPDGKYIAIVGHFDIQGGGKDIELWDSAGKKLWRFTLYGVQEFLFSPDSKYLVAGLGGGAVIVLDLLGNITFKDDFAVATGLSSITISKNADYIGTSGVHRTAIIDKQGNILLDGGKSENNMSFVNKEGTRGVLWDGNRVDIYNMPNKALLKTYNIGLIRDGMHKRKMDMSSDGRYMALTGKKTSSASPSNIFVIDLVEDKIWETQLIGFDYITISMSTTGQYLLIETSVVGKKSAIYYYQIY